jgi:hypothetical protein
MGARYEVQEGGRGPAREVVPLTFTTRRNALVLAGARRWADGSPSA